MILSRVRLTLRVRLKPEAIYCFERVLVYRDSPRSNVTNPRIAETNMVARVTRPPRE